MSNDHAQPDAMVKLIWRTCALLAVVTVVEVAAAISLTGYFTEHHLKIVLNTFYILMSVTKAFYIVSIFMHLKFELKFMAVTILIPMFFLLFAVMTMLAEGNSWLHMRNY